MPKTTALVSRLWPDERPVSTLLHNLKILTRADALEGHYRIAPEGETVIVKGVSHQVIGEVSIFFPEIESPFAEGYHILIISTKKDGVPYFVLVVEAIPGIQSRVVSENDEHRNKNLAEIYSMITSPIFARETLIPKRITEYRQYGLYSANQLFEIPRTR